MADAPIIGEAQSAWQWARRAALLTREAGNRKMALQEIASGVFHLTDKIVNIYFVGQPDREWTLIDAGLPGSAAKIQAAARSLYGPNRAPLGIVLTHGHLDHVGGLPMLSDAWNVPIYAHRLEWPYLTGKAAYPPPDPTVGGAMPFLSRFFPPDIHQFGDRLRELPGQGSLAILPDWTLIHTPGHSPGHVSLFRESDRTLIAGDAFVTTNNDTWYGLITQRPEICRPPTYYTIDWDAAAESARALAERKPITVATGHGVPLSGPEVAETLANFARHFPFPSQGRYFPTPARTDAEGVAALPPRPFDPLPRLAAKAGLAALAVVSLALLNQTDRKRRTPE